MTKESLFNLIDGNDSGLKTQYGKRSNIVQDAECM